MQSEIDGEAKEIGGRKYISQNRFMEEFLYADPCVIPRLRGEGMPYVKSGQRYWYNVEDCKAWHRGVYEENKKAVRNVCKRSAEKKTTLRKI